MTSNAARVIQLPQKPKTAESAAEGCRPVTLGDSSWLALHDSFILDGVKRRTPPAQTAEHAMLLLGQAQAALDTGDLTSAARLLESTLSQFPNHVPGLFLLAFLRDRAGESDAARTLYRAAHTLKPECWEALFNIALLEINAGHRVEALATLNEAAAIAPQAWPIAFELAKLFDEAGNSGKARYWYQRAAESHAPDPGVFLGLGLIELEDGRFPEAAAALGRALQTPGQEACAHYHLGLCQLELGEREGARESFEEAIRTDPCHCGALKGLALLALVDGDVETASIWYGGLRDNGEASAPLLLSIARLWQERDRHDEARAAYREAVLLDPSIASGYFG